MKQPKETLFRLALLSGLVALRAPASTLLPPATTLADCAVDSSRLLSPTSCALNLAGSASASLSLSPFVILTARAASPPNDSAIHGAAASAALTYSFEVIGGNPGDIVPVLIATSLSSLGSDPSHGIGFAELSVHTGAAGDSFVAVCSNGTCGTTASSFSGTLRTRARSGDTSNELTLQIQASTGDSLLATSATASADPFIFIDPSFPGAALYSIAVSPGIGNAEITAAPEPGTITLFLGAATLLGVVLRRRKAAGSVAYVAAPLWLAVGVDQAEAGVMLQTPLGLNPGDHFRFVFVTDGFRDATSENIADYDGFVQAQAGGSTYQGMVVHWLAIASTASVDADHVGQATAPVYLSDGTLVTTTTTLAGLWSRALVHEIDLDLRPTPFIPSFGRVRILSEPGSRTARSHTTASRFVQRFRRRLDSLRPEHQRRLQAPLRDLIGSHHPTSRRPRAFHPGHAGRSGQRGSRHPLELPPRAQRSGPAQDQTGGSLC